MSIYVVLRRAFLRTGIAVAIVGTVVACDSHESVGRVTPAHTPDSLLGQWGGRDIGMTVDLEGSLVTYDCADGTIESAIVPDADGQFVVEGTFRWVAGLMPDNGGPRHAALYQGTIVGNTMDLSVTVIDLNETHGPFTLTQGDPGVVNRCM